VWGSFSLGTDVFQKSNAFRLCSVCAPCVYVGTHLHILRMHTCTCTHACYVCTHTHTWMDACVARLCTLGTCTLTRTQSVHLLCCQCRRAAFGLRLRNLHTRDVHTDTHTLTQHSRHTHTHAGPLTRINSRMLLRGQPKRYLRGSSKLIQR
jgi:hypothetical protein